MEDTNSTKVVVGAWSAQTYLRLSSMDKSIQTRTGVSWNHCWLQVCMTADTGQNLSCISHRHRKSVDSFQLHMFYCYFKTNSTLWAKAALGPGRKIFCLQELFNTYALQGSPVWVCHAGVSSLMPPCLSPQLEIDVLSPTFNECSFWQVWGYSSETQKLPLEISFLFQLFSWLGKNSEIWTIAWT